MKIRIILIKYNILGSETSVLKKKTEPSHPFFQTNRSRICPFFGWIYILNTQKSLKHLSKILSCFFSNRLPSNKKVNNQKFRFLKLIRFGEPFQSDNNVERYGEWKLNYFYCNISRAYLISEFYVLKFKFLDKNF